MAFDRKEKNKEIFEDTMRLCRSNNRLKKAIKASESKQYIVEEQAEILVDKTKKYNAPAQIIVSKKRSLEAAGNKEYQGLKVCVLNFASATNPGGGVSNGSSAQEECLCRCSTLYPNINKNNIRQEFHEKHKMLLKQNHMNATYNDDCIFTPEVIVFKTDDNSCKIMEETQWYNVDIITCAAPNLRKRPSNAMNPNSGMEAVQISQKQLKELHQKRLRRILSIAKQEKEDVVILGAFGCGAFQNPPEVVAKAFEETIQEFLFDFQVIEFAVYCTPSETRNYDTFCRVFGK